MQNTIFKFIDFTDVFSANLTPLPQKTITFFDIAGFPHYENVMSNFYAYFMSPGEQHGLGDLFLSALNNIITREKGNGYIALDNPQNCTVEREVCTDSGKFIDLVVKSGNGTVAENALVIENKVYATVYNDLEDYIGFVKANKKTGIVLSLKKIPNLGSGFISITHEELLREIQQSPGTYFLNTESRQLLILKEFIQNIKSMSQTNDLKEYYDFFIQHNIKIKELNSLYETIKTDIYRQADVACEQLNMDLELKSNYSSRLRYYVSKKAPEVYFTILLEDVLSKYKLYIYIEINKEGITHLAAINKLPGIDVKKVRESYLHITHRECDVPEQNLKNFTGLIIDEINKSIDGISLKDTFHEIENCILEDKVRK